MLELKLHLYKILGIFIPYFKRKYMNTEIYNAIKNEVDNRIKDYPNKDLFQMKLIINSEKPYSVIYSCAFEGVGFRIESEYMNNQIQFSFINDSALSISSLLAISHFVEWLKLMPQENLTKRIDEFLKKHK